MQVIECPQCSKPLSDANIDHDANIIVCDACDAVFSTPSPIAVNGGKKKTGNISIPERFNIVKDDVSLEISYKHNTCFGIAMGVFALIWNGMLWAIFVPAFGFVALDSFSTETGIDSGALIFPLFLIPFILAGVYVAYQALFLLLNTSTVKATHKSLTIMHRPISIPFDKVIDTNTIDQLFTKQKITRGSGGTQITYQVYVKFTNGKNKKLLDMFPEAKQAFFIEREIENFLGIDDQYVEGEYHPGDA